MLGDLLETAGYRVLRSGDGLSALALMGDASRDLIPGDCLPDLILSDITMPGMDGYKLCETLKNDARLRDIPLIFMSELGETMDKVRAFRAGGVDYVTKPFHFEEVRARIETHLHLHRLHLAAERHNRELENLVASQVKAISEAQMATILALAKLAESRDDDTGKHLERVQLFCRLLATCLARRPKYERILTAHQIEAIFHASALHDIGKVAIPDAILLKPGKLDEAEFAIMRTHTILGAKTLGAVREKYPNNSFIDAGIEIALHHHEKWDGSGYPAGISGEDIPLAARIMAVADVYDALTTKRCYKPAFTHEKSRDIILHDSGTHFDPEVAACFGELEGEFREIRARACD